MAHSAQCFLQTTSDKAGVPCRLWDVDVTVAWWCDFNPNRPAIRLMWQELPGQTKSVGAGVSCCAAPKSSKAERLVTRLNITQAARMHIWFAFLTTNACPNVQHLPLHKYMSTFPFMPGSSHQQPPSALVFNFFLYGVVSFVCLLLNAWFV